MAYFALARFIAAVAAVLVIAIVAGAVIAYVHRRRPKH